MKLHKIYLPSFTCLARALVRVIDRCWVATCSSPCFLAVAVAPRICGPKGPGTMNHTTRVVLGGREVRWATVLLHFLVSGAVFTTIGCRWIVAVPTLGLPTRRLAVLVVVAGTPCSPAAPIAINGWITGSHLQQKRS